jgi:hypothetical protein
MIRNPARAKIGPVRPFINSPKLEALSGVTETSFLKKR